MNVYASLKSWGLGIDIGIGEQRGATFYAARPVEFVEVDRGDYIPPVLTLNMHAAQQLMDELWGCGVRPTEGTGSAGSLAATERHLADMRQMAFAALKMQKP